MILSLLCYVVVVCFVFFVFFLVFFFFFQAEDGIRDGTVTGVQTCALPIYPAEIVEAFIGGAILVNQRLTMLESQDAGNGLITVGGQTYGKSIAHFLRQVSKPRDGLSRKPVTPPCPQYKCVEFIDHARTAARFHY